MDITQIQAVKAAGTATVRVVTESVIQHIPADHAYIEITTRRFDTYKEGVEIEPEVTRFRKTDLLNESAGIDKQIETLIARKAAIEELLKEFSVEEVKL
jgi:hypothetical protein